MDLDERKLKILTAVIKNYLETGEPVGSRTISKYTDLNLSSATIRNEMSDLEELGYIVQPHTSAGRIPSDKGYRLYVDNLMNEKLDELEKREESLNRKEELLIEKVDKVDTLLQNVAKLLADNTNYASLVSKPRYSQNRIKFMQVSKVDEHSLLLVMVMEGNKIRNKVLKVKVTPDDKLLLTINVSLNTVMAGKEAEEISISTLSKLNSQISPDDEDIKKLMNDILISICELCAPDENVEIYTSGANNIFKYPELSDKSKASEIISTFEAKEGLDLLLTEDDADAGIKVYIGNETPISSMKDCSVVTATYEFEDGVRGTIGIVGPKRMDYEKVVDNIKMIKRQLDDTFRKE